MKTILQALRLLVVLTILTGIAYPLAVTAVTRVAFPSRTSGSLVARDGTPIGSALLAQKFESPRYFWPRPSGADYATVPSGASNLGPTSEPLRKAIAERREKFGASAPVDLLTTSASGLDPEISPEAAAWQVARVAAARNLPADRVAALVREVTQGPQYGIFGEPRVNVLALNLRLDDLEHYPLSSLQIWGGAATPASFGAWPVFTNTGAALQMPQEHPRRSQIFVKTFVENALK